MVVRTKLNHPRSRPRSIPRPRLANLLAAGLEQGLVLVSAPAGYGKTVLVADWLRSQALPGAWLSLDATDNDLHTFVAGFVAAVRTIFPGACARTAALLSAPALPDVSSASASLADDLEAIGTPFVLALDDYHCIEDCAVHGLVADLVRRLPLPLHLVLTTRHDPPLPLARLRAHGRIAEVRSEHLRFSRSESAELLCALADVAPSERALDELERQNEGWAVGLQLIGLALRGRADTESFLSDLGCGPSSVRDYLVEEVLDALPVGLRDWLVETSVLDRFCAPLCETLCGVDLERAKASGLDGEGFLAALQERGLFATALDPEGEWYRYHHVFRDLLRGELEARRSPQQIAALHSRASQWFAEHDLVEEALDHALRAGDPAYACALVSKRRHALMNQEDWHRLNGWLERLPAASRQADPGLLLAEAWYQSFCNRLQEAHRLLENARAAPLEGSPDDEALIGEMDALEAQLHYMAGDPKGVLRAGLRALDVLPDEFEILRGYTVAEVAWAHSALGRVSTAQRLLWHAMETGRAAGASYRGMVGAGLGAFLFREGDLEGALGAARQLYEIGKANVLPESVLYGRSLAGWAHYLRNELDQAEPYLEAVVEDVGPALKTWHAQSCFALALCRMARGRIDDARHVAHELTAGAIDRMQPGWIEEGRAIEAEVALRQGRIAAAQAWAETFDPERPFRCKFLYVPQLTLAKLRLAQGTEASLRQAAAVLNWVQRRLEKTPDNLLRAEVLAVGALVRHAQGDGALATDALESSLALTGPGRAIRLYVDLGPPMAALLKMLPAAVSESEPVRGILAAFPSGSGRGSGRPCTGGGAGAPGRLVEPLTSREQEVLALLAERYQDKEIAAMLFIAPGTVRAHLKAIYRKLDAGGRREAVRKAAEIGVLIPSPQPHAQLEPAEAIARKSCASDPAGSRLRAVGSSRRERG